MELKADLAMSKEKLQELSMHRRSLSMKLKKISIIGETENKLFGNNKASSTKRFPREIFKPPTHRKKPMLITEIIKLKPFPPKLVLDKALPQFQLTGITPLNKFMFSPSLILLPTSLHSTKRFVRNKSNQHINLGMPLKRSPKKIDSLKPTDRRLKLVKRTIHSSQGSTTKILLPRSFIIPKLPSFTKKHMTIQCSPFLNKLFKEAKCDSQKHVEGSIKNTKEKVDLGYITFGRHE